MSWKGRGHARRGQALPARAVLNRVPTTGGQAAGYGYYGKSYYYRQDKAGKPSEGTARPPRPRHASQGGCRARPATRQLDVPMGQPPGSRRFEQLLRPTPDGGTRRLNRNR